MYHTTRNSNPNLPPSLSLYLLKLLLIYILAFLPPITLSTSNIGHNSGNNGTSIGNNSNIINNNISFNFGYSHITAHANNLPITPDGSTHTVIDSALNGVPIINIAAPNAGGLSHNKFVDYNVNAGGLIINNAINNPNQIIGTKIGGIIVDNPHLVGSNSASVILNEVTSNNRSILRGYTEIAGRSADLIIANPNGIEMNDAGFINISRLTNVVGSSNQFNPHPKDLTCKFLTRY